MAIYSSDEHNKEFNEKLAKLANEQLAKHTIPIFEKNYLGQLCFLGSGVFLKTKDKYLILTAAHVINSTETIFWIPTQAGIIPLNESTVVNQTKNDIGFIALPVPIGELLQYSSNPVIPKKILVEYETINEHHYLTVGYPETLINIVGNRVEFNFEYYLHKPSLDGVYKFYNLNKSDYYCLDLGKTLDFSGKKLKISPLNGMSGCGLWHIDFHMINGSMRLFYHLIGIMTDFRNGKYHVFFGTKIDKVVELVDGYYEFITNNSHNTFWSPNG